MNKTDEILPVLPRNKMEKHTNDQLKSEREDITADSTDIKKIRE